MKISKPRVLDLFSGAGGMSLGFAEAGFHISAAVDNWQDALDTLRHNHPDIKTANIDLSSKSKLDVFLEELVDVDVIVGGPPCQGFSIAGKRDPEDPRNKLYSGFVKAVSTIRPSYFVMENVPTIGSPSNRPLFNSIIEDFQNLGYAVTADVLLASQFGVPQNRRRMFIVGSSADNALINFPIASSRFVTTKEAISDLPENSQSDGSEYMSTAQSDYQTQVRINAHSVFNHQVTDHSARTQEVIAQVPDGGNYKDLPERFRGIRNVNIAWTRLNSEKPSFTIDTGHRHHFHYKYNRVPTARESARLQSFPDTFQFLGSKTSQLKQIGNAVPPLLAKALADNILMRLGG